MQVQKMLKRWYGATDADFWSVPVPGLGKNLLFVKPSLLTSLQELANDQPIYGDWFDETRVVNRSLSGSGVISLTLNSVDLPHLEEMTSYSIESSINYQSSSARTPSQNAGVRFRSNPRSDNLQYVGPTGSRQLFRDQTTSATIGVATEMRLGSINDSFYVAFKSSNTMTYYEEVGGSAQLIVPTPEPISGSMDMNLGNAYSGYSYVTKAVPAQGEWALHDGWILAEGPTLIGSFEVCHDLYTGNTSFLNVVTSAQLAAKMIAYRDLQNTQNLLAINKQITTLQDNPLLRFGACTNFGEHFILADAQLKDKINVIRTSSGVEGGIDLTKVNDFLNSNASTVTFSYEVGADLPIADMTDTGAGEEVILSAVEKNYGDNEYQVITNGNPMVFSSFSLALSQIQSFINDGYIAKEGLNLSTEEASTVSTMVSNMDNKVSETNGLPTKRFGTTFIVSIGSKTEDQSKLLGALLTFPNVLEERV